MRHLPILALSLAVLGSVPVPAQQIISAKSGLLHFQTGEVLLNGQRVEKKAAVFPAMAFNSSLRTLEGRAEVLLTPGVFLRLGDHSAVTMLDNRLESTRLELTQGYAVIEADDPQLSSKNSPVTILVGETEVRLLRRGLIGIHAATGMVRVFSGQAEVTRNSASLILKEGRFVSLNGEFVAKKFDAKKTSNGLLAWSRDRSQELAATNLYIAGTLRNSAGGGAGWGGGWYYNPVFGSYSYLPGSGTVWNPWGFGFYSPRTVFGSTGISPLWFRNVIANSSNSEFIAGSLSAPPRGSLQPGGALPSAGAPDAGEFGGASRAARAFMGAAAEIRQNTDYNPRPAFEGFGGFEGGARNAGPGFGQMPSNAGDFGGARAGGSPGFGGGGGMQPSIDGGHGGGAGVDVRPQGPPQQQ